MDEKGIITIAAMQHARWAVWYQWCESEKQPCSVKLRWAPRRDGGVCATQGSNPQNTIKDIFGDSSLNSVHTTKGPTEASLQENSVVLKKENKIV